MAKILVIDDEEILARTIARFLCKRGYLASYATDEKKAWEIFQKESPSFCLLDYRLGSTDGVELLKRMKKAKPQVDVIMMTGYGDMKVAIAAMKAGAKDFLVKPVPLASIESMASELMRDGISATLNHGAARIIGHSAATLEIRASIERIVEATRSLKDCLPGVLITGESGTGKDLVARAIHQDGPRSNGPLICVNCASLPSELVESELFGHVKGAFTDARADKAGLFEAANGGVLFLDEIGDMPLAAQAKLLRVLESQTVRRVGSTNDVSVDVWVIAATNQCIAQMVADGAFRADLLFRLQVLWVEVPPLSSRDGDVLLLAEHFLEEFRRKYDISARQLAAGARVALLKHQWPGNIRELRNVIERAVLMCSGEQLLESHLHFSTPPVSRLQRLDGSATLEEHEIQLLRSALERANGNVTKAASDLGITRDTLRYRIEKYGLNGSKQA
ncbi:MAG: sigma-54 dependent transcriptional regulator [Burkholderiaceae bacterium]